MRFYKFVAVAIAFLAASPALAQDLDFLFALVDFNHDDAIQVEEVEAFGALQWRGFDPDQNNRITAEALEDNPRGRSLVGDMLPEDGGVLTRDEFLDGLVSRARGADGNGDGALDVAEFRIFMGAPLPLSSESFRRPTLPSLAEPFQDGLPRCSELTEVPSGLGDQAGVTQATARIVPGNAVNAAYCQVQFVYNSGRAGPEDGYAQGQQQAITIRVGLPLRPEDGGTTGWNGRIQNVGSGGCMGLLPSVTVATNAGFASASSDGGHGAPWMAFDCGFAVIQDEGRLNEGLIRDFSAEHVRWQTYWSKRLVEAYYGQPSQRTYWCGCSQGGREGFIALQELPEEYDGILAGGAALYWMRFQMAQAWSGLVIKDILAIKGKTLTPAEISQTVALEIEACDPLDGVIDGVLDDPRRCSWSARSAICGVAGAAPANCLDADQARAFDMVRQGPRNHLGERIWFPWEPGTVFSNDTNYLLSDGMMQWAVRDLGFSSAEHLYLDEAALNAANDPLGITYEDMATLASQTVSDLVDMSDPRIDRARESGVKILAWTGTADRNIMSRNTIKYYRDVAEHFQADVSDSGLQDWFRVFLYPGVDHCAGGEGPQPGSRYDGPLFDALVRWVEQDEPPTRIFAVNRAPSGEVIRSRPVCPYPTTAQYSGQGSIDDAANFVCGGNLETVQVLADAELAPHKAENVNGQIPANYSINRK